MLTSVVVSSAFDKKVKSLSSDWHDVEKAMENLAERQLRFAQHLVVLETEAKALDGNQDGANQARLYSEFAKLVNSTSPSVRSKWQTIGRFSEQMLPLSKNLPPQIESLYLLTNAFTKKKQPLAKWISSGALSSQMSVRDTRALLTSKSPKKKPKSSKRAKLQEINVKLTFEGNYSSVADALLALLEDKQSGLKSIRAENAVISGCKAKLPPATFDDLESKGVFNVGK